jgi:ketosteroid isomerase-like protein
MHPHEALIRRFYARLAARDAEGALACYHPEVFFSDPLHPRLRGEPARDLWRLRLGDPAFGEIALEEASADANGALTRWTAHGVVRGRPVTIRGRSMFAFRDGRIVRHYDHYSLWRWTAQAFGSVGAALGWFGPFRWALRTRAARALERFSAARPAS